MKWEKQETVTASRCDVAARLSLLGIFDSLEDAVTDLMGDLSIDGLSTIANYHAFWVFTRHRIRLYRRPVWRETCHMEAFLSSRTPAKIGIDVLWHSATGERLAEGRTELCALDLDTGRIRKTVEVGVQDRMLEPSVVTLPFTRLADPEGETVDRVTVRSTCIDYGHHTNNIEYLRMIFNTYPSAVLQKRNFREIGIDFFAQSFENEELTVLKSTQIKTDLAGNPTKETADRFYLMKGDKKAVCCEVLWEE